MVVILTRCTREDENIISVYKVKLPLDLGKHIVQNTLRGGESLFQSK